MQVVSPLSLVIGRHLAVFVTVFIFPNSLQNAVQRLLSARAGYRAAVHGIAPDMISFGPPILVPLRTLISLHVHLLEKGRKLVYLSSLP